MDHWEIRDANGKSLGGNAHIPLPDNWTYEEDKLRLRNEHVDNRSIRVAYIWGGRDQDGVPFLTVVSQSNEMRATLQKEILTGMLKPRSEERRVGKACGSTCRYRWSHYP